MPLKIIFLLFALFSAAISIFKLGLDVSVHVDTKLMKTSTNVLVAAVIKDNEFITVL